nr:glycosyltransferase [uncultured Desulfobacter sp.]
MEAELFALQNSTFWRATAPLRMSVDKVRCLVRENPRLARFLKGILFRSRSRPVPGLPEAERKGESVPSLDELKITQKKTFEADLKQFLEAGNRLDIKKSDAPRVSILLVLFNQAALTFRCLRSIAAELNIPIEVIVIDNNSQDETSAMIKQISGITYVHNRENINFLKAVNQAAEMACGDHILLLNNDAALLPGTLANAVFRLENDPENGAVGGKIILVDGSLQEAGSIIWQDGSCLGYGRQQNPDAPQFQFLRTVDYCSGAFLLIRRNLFEELDRFDEAYAPAYYEESDFCMRLTKAGYRVLYDPCVEILHYEFGSSASTEQALSLQRRNRKRLVEKHQETLTKKPAASPGEILNARDLTQYHGRVLFIEDRVPHDALGSGFPRCRTIVQSLIKLGMFITFYPLRFPKEDWDETYETLPRQVEVMLDHGMESLQHFLQERQGYYDYILVSRPHNMEIVKYLYDKHPSLFKGMDIVYDAEAIFALREIRKQEVTGRFCSPRKYQKQLEDEMNLARVARNIITVSPLEAKHFTRAGYNNIHVLSHSLKPKPTPALFEERKGLFFVGSLDHDDSPNVDSLVWFVKKVMPELKKRCDIPIILTAAGGAGSRQVLDLTSEELVLTGRVEDLAPLFNFTRVFIVPTRFAAGVPHKAHEAASHGVPMVTTSLIAEQLGWQDKKDLLIANDPVEFASRILDLYENQALWLQLRENALARIQTECSKKKFEEELEKIFCSSSTQHDAEE